MKSFIRKKLQEGLGVPSFSLPKPISVDDNTMALVKTITWSDIKINNTGDNGHDTLYFSIAFKNDTLNQLNEGINFTIQLLYDTYYQPHMFITPTLQGIGLTPKIFKSFIMEYGHIYAGNGRTLNQDASKVLSKLENDPDFESFRGENGLLIMKKGNLDKEKLLKIVS
jgi:hypothetical protein